MNVVTVVSALLMTFLILIQTRGADIGAGFGSSGEVFGARRGVDKTIFQITVLVAVVFVLSIVFGIITSN